MALVTVVAVAGASAPVAATDASSPAAEASSPTASAGASQPSVAAGARAEQPTPGANETRTVNESRQFTIDATIADRCGDRCRRVVANLTNEMNETAHNVTAVTRITVDGERIWKRNNTLGNVSANESVQRRARVTIGFRETLRIMGNDGRVTLNTTVYWDGGSATFTERRRVL